MTNALHTLAGDGLTDLELDDEAKRRARDASIYDLAHRFEVGHMGAKYFTPMFSKVVYASLVLYLYGTLAVYSISVPDSLQKIGWGSDDNHAHYFIYCTAFAAIVFPLCFGNFENTKPVQVVYISYLFYQLIFWECRWWCSWCG